MIKPSNVDSPVAGPKNAFTVFAAALVPTALVMLTAWSTLDARFVTGDDERLILNHVLVNRPTPANAWKLASRFADDLYQPVAMISFQLNYALAGPDPLSRFPVDPRGFHAVNLTLHAFNALLVFLVLRRIYECTRVALISASLFAVHPFAVETYAWINGRMILLATFFALLATYITMSRAHSIGTGRSLLVSLLWAMSQASKALPTAPVVAAFADLRRAESRTIGRFMLYGLLIALGGGATLMAARTTLDAVGLDTLTDSSRSPRIVQIVMATRYYLENYFWPARLSAWSPPTTETSLFSWPVLLGWGEIFVMIAGAILLVRRCRRSAWGLAAFVALLAPFLAAGTTRHFLAADRYMYLPMIALHATVATWLIAAADGISGRLGRVVGGKVIGFPVIVCVLALLVQSRRLCDSWHDSVTRDQRVAEVWPDRPEVLAQLAKSCLAEGQLDAASKVIEEADARWPNHPRVAAAAGDLWRHRGDLVKAEQRLRVARDGMPGHLRTQYQHALTLEELGREEEARRTYEAILERSDRFLPAATALARYYKRRGDIARAELYYRRALAINPLHPDALRFIVSLTSQRGENAEAIDCLNRLLDLLPGDREARLLRARLWIEEKPDEAINEFRAMIARDATDFEATLGLHRALARQARYSELTRLWEEPAFMTMTEARAWRTWAMALSGNREEASRLASAIPDNEPVRLFADWALVYAALKSGDAGSAHTFVGNPARALKLAGHTDDMHEMILDTFSRLPVKMAHHPAAYYVAALSFFARGSSVDLDAAEMICNKILDSTREEFWRRAAGALMDAVREKRTTAFSPAPP